MKCRRTVCNNEATQTHTQTGEKYCLPCAIKINKACNLPGLVEVPEDRREIARRIREIHDNGGEVDP